MNSAYRRLQPSLRLFVDAVIAGEKPTHAMRRLRPQLKRPDVLASKWKARPEVRAAIAERQAHATALEERITKLEEQLADRLLSSDAVSDANKQRGLEGLRRTFPADRHESEEPFTVGDKT